MTITFAAAIALWVWLSLLCLTGLVFATSCLASLFVNRLEKIWAEREQETARAATLGGRVRARLSRKTA